LIVKNEKSIVAVEGLPFIIPSLVMVVVSLFFFPWWATAIFGAIFVFVTAFFRNPQREIPSDPRAVVSPADGRIIEIKQVREKEFIGGDALRICVFMNVFNVHINRIPFGGKVKKVRYYPGKFFVASLDKASEENERNAVLIEGAGGIKILVIQIAGLVARRIVSYLAQDDEVRTGQRFGLIRFGSRLDLYLPTNTVVKVAVGDKVRGGTTIMGVLP
jgi:phosphatidylserine decarboxylase